MDGRQRLARLVEVLRNLPEPDHYDQATVNSIVAHRDETPDEWKQVLEQNGIDLDEPLPQFLNARIVCHTSACAGGEAAYDPELQAEGLRWKRRDEGDAGTTPARYFTSVNLGGLYNLSYIHGRSWGDGWGSVLTEFFEISSDVMSDLFADSTQTTPTQKANQIEDFLKTGVVRPIYDFQKEQPDAN